MNLNIGCVCFSGFFVLSRWICSEGFCFALVCCCCGSGGGEKKLAAMPSREPNYYLAAEEQQEEEEEEEEENSERDSDEEDGDGRPSPVGSASHWPQSYKYYPHLPYPIPSDILPSSQAMHSFIPSCLNSTLNSVLDSWVAADSTEEPEKTRNIFCSSPLAKSIFLAR